MDDAARDFDRYRLSGPGDAILRAARRLADTPEPDTTSLERALWLEASAHDAASNSYNRRAASLLDRASDVYTNLGRDDDALYLRASALAARINAARGDLATAAPMCRQLDALAAAMPADVQTAIRVEVNLMAGFGWLAAQQYAAALPPFRAAEADAKGSPYHWARVIGARALLEGQSGDSDQAILVSHVSRDLADEIGDRLQFATMAQYLAGLYAGSGDLRTALQQAEAAMLDAPQQSELFHATTLRLRGTLNLTTGNDAAGIEDLGNALALAVRHRDCDLPTAAPIVTTLVQHYLAASETAEAARLLREYDVDLQTLTGEQQTEADLLRYAAFVEERQFSDAALAIDRAAQAYDAAHHPDAADVYGAAAEAWLAAGDAARSEKCRAHAARLSG